jgi:hypothetical protein
MVAPIPIIEKIITPLLYRYGQLAVFFIQVFAIIINTLPKYPNESARYIRKPILPG